MYVSDLMPAWLSYAMHSPLCGRDDCLDGNSIAACVASFKHVLTRLDVFRMLAMVSGPSFFDVKRRKTRCKLGIRPAFIDVSVSSKWKHGRRALSLLSEHESLASTSQRSNGRKEITDFKDMRDTWTSLLLPSVLAKHT